MTRTDVFRCMHEPFTDPFYFGPERLAERFAHLESRRLSSGKAEETYRDVMEAIAEERKHVSDVL